MAVPSLALFFISSLLMGGDALNGYTVDGQYYLGGRGKYTEVSKRVFDVSWYLGVIGLTAFIPMVLCGAFSAVLGSSANKRDTSDKNL